MADILERGESLNYTITFKDINDIIIDTSTISEIWVELYWKSTGTILAKYSKNILAGYTPLTMIVPTTLGQCSFYLAYTSTISAPIDELVIEIKYLIGVDRMTEKGILGRFIDSKIKSL